MSHPEEQSDNDRQGFDAVNRQEEEKRGNPKTRQEPKAVPGSRPEPTRGHSHLHGARLKDRLKAARVFGEYADVRFHLTSLQALLNCETVRPGR